MISALRGYAESEPTPPDAAMVMKTTEYPRGLQPPIQEGYPEQKNH